MRYDTEHKEKTRERILAAAAKEIRAQGPHRVGVAAVMSKAGLTHGGFYAHFESKEALIAAAIEYMFAGARGKFERVTQDKPADKALTAYIDFYLSVTHRDAVASGCPIASLSTDSPRLSLPARSKFTSGVDRLTKALAEKIKQLDRDHSQQEASSVLAELIGAIALARAEPDAMRSEKILDRSRRALKTRLGLRN